MKADTGRKSVLGTIGIVCVVTIKAFCGVALVLMTAVTWKSSSEVLDRQRAVESWADARDYAVFSPVQVGADAEDFKSGGIRISVAEDGLFSDLEKAGALYIDAGQYRPGIPQGGVPLPAAPIRVNLNYLERYPILDEHGVPIRITQQEQRWVVVVADKFKSSESSIVEFMRTARRGAPGILGAARTQERMREELRLLLPVVPQRFFGQDVKIIWAKSDQRIFSFDSNVNPNGENMIIDPVIEVMTPENALPIDRFNAITGRVDTPLKVRVDGDSNRVLRDLAPTLERLHLDDNLHYLVTPHEAMNTEVQVLKNSLRWMVVIVAGLLLGMLLSSASFIAILYDRWRRTFIVRRLHGVGFLKTYRQVLILVWATWLGQSAIACLVAFWVFTGRGSTGIDGNSVEWPQLTIILVAIAVVELSFAAAVAVVLERRNAVKRLKEL